jgi:bacillithiol system protein YtxJ
LRDASEWILFRYEGLPENAGVTCVKVDVVNSRALSQELAREFTIRHESPQIIWIRGDNQVDWHASHYSITPEMLDTQLQKFSPGHQ